MGAGPEAEAGPVVVREAHRVEPRLLAALAELLPQLSSSSPPLDEEHLRQIVEGPATTLLVAEDAGGRVLGSLTLALFRVPTGVRAWIEDVVVDEASRGHGVGQALVTSALERAREAGARTVDLTSRPSREAANRLYRRLGFAPRETNVYRYEW